MLQGFCDVGELDPEAGNWARHQVRELQIGKREARMGRVQGARALATAGLSWVLLGAGVLAGCGGEETTSSADASAAKDTAAQDLPAADTVTTDTGTTDTGTGDAAASACGQLPGCLNSSGQEDLSLCPKPASDYQCVKGCCIAKLVCKTAADCAAQLGIAPGCPNKGFTCVCDVEAGECIQGMCGADADCPKGQVCSQGGCKAAPALGDLSARLLRPVWITGPNVSVVAAEGLGAQAVDAQGNVKVDAEFEWTLDGASAFAIEGANLKALDKAGKALITAKVKGSSKAASKPGKLWNLGALPADKNLRVTAVDEFDSAPLTGKLVVIGLADASTPEAAVVVDLVDGQAAVANVKFPADIHLVPKDHAPISVLRYDPAGKPADLLLPSPLQHFAELEFDEGGKIITEKTKVIHGDAVTGTVNYPGDGEASLGLTALAFGPQLLNFSVDAILGPNVRRPFAKDAPTFVNPDPGKPQEIPGGVTFSLGKPVVTHFVVAGAPGGHTVWTLAGRLALSGLLEEVGKIFDAVDGGLDIGKVVSVLLPYLSGFSSQVLMDVALGETLSNPIKSLPQLDPKFPLLLKTEIAMPALPKSGSGWADLVFVIGGALMPIGEIVPLGLTAGADSQGKEDPADGKVDADPKTAGTQQLKLAVAPLHSGLHYGADNHVFITAAIVLAEMGKKEGGSIILSKPKGVPAVYNPGEFMALPEGSALTKATGVLQVAAVTGAHIYRVNLTGAEGKSWQVVVPKSLEGKAVTLPDLTAYGATLTSATAKRALVAAFELSKSMTTQEFVAPGGLSDIVRQVNRTSFTDAAK